MGAIKGLVLAGGKSRRMGIDKGSLVFGQVPEAQRLYSLLAAQCDEVLVSCRAEQLGASHLEGLPLLADRREDAGPMEGLLRAFENDGTAAWLVVACDMPFVGDAAIAELVRARDPEKVATCFWNEEREWPEPLCAIYEPQAAELIRESVAAGRGCPRKLLMANTVEAIRPSDARFVSNINTPEALEGARLALAN